MTGMDTLVWGLGWTAMAVALFMLPLLPAFAELRARRDIGPIPIDDADNGETAYRLEALAPRLPDLATLGHAKPWLQAETYVVPSGAHLPSARTGSAVHMQAGATADVLISGSTLVMEQGAQVHHLVHAETLISRGAVTLNGRASAGSLVVLAAGSRTFRVAAPCIVTAPLTAAPQAVVRDEQPTPLTRVPERHTGDLVIEEGKVRLADLVVSGNLALGKDARVVGHIKAHGNIELAEGAAVEGAMFAGGHILCHGSNRVQGPISAAWRVELGNGTCAGSADVPCSVSGWEVVLGHSVAVFGAIASVGGCHVSEPS